MIDRYFYRILTKAVVIITGLLFSMPALSSAEGTVKSLNGSSLIKKSEEDWHPLKEGEPVEDGATIWIGASSSIVLKAGDKLIELSGGPVGSNIVIRRFEPFDASIKGAGVRYLGALLPPAAPSLLTPPDGFRSREEGIELAWSSPEKEALYHIQMSTRPEFDRNIIDEKSYNNGKKLERLGAGRYFWRISVINNEGLESGFSDARTFEIKPLLLPPTLNSPASTKTSTTFRWKRKGEGERYHLQISKRKDFSETTVDLKNVEGPRLTVGMLEEGDYFVRVSAIDEEGFEGRFSDSQQFYVGQNVPSSNIAPMMIILSVAFMLLGGH